MGGNRLIAAALLCISTLLPLSPSFASPIRSSPARSERVQALTRLVEEVFGAGRTKTDDSGEWVCGTSLVFEVSLLWDSLAEETRELIPMAFRPERIRKSQGASARPDTTILDQIFESESRLPGEDGHFRIHYTRTGEDSIWYSVGDLADALEETYKRLHGPGGLGFPRPLSDGTRGGGQDRVDFYVWKLPADILGVAHPEYAATDSNDCGAWWSGYLQITSDFGPGAFGAEKMACVATHEYFHLVQYGSIPLQLTWLKESTATWAEKAVWPTSIFYSYFMNHWFLAPYLSLWRTEPSNREYGCVHYWLYLEERFGDPRFVSKVFEGLCRPDPIDPEPPAMENAYWIESVNRVLRSYGVADSDLTPFDETLPGFFEWNATTGRVRDDGGHYADGVDYPPVFAQAHHDDYPVRELRFLENGGAAAEAAGGDYIEFHPTTEYTELEIHFDGLLGADRRRVCFVRTKNGNEHSVTELAPDEEGDVSFAVSDWNELDCVTMIVVNFDNATSDLEFEYSADEMGETVPSRLLKVTARPSAFGASTSNGKTAFFYDIEGETAETVIDIYRPNGRHVDQLRDSPAGHGRMRVEWDGRDKDGYLLPSGVYLYRLQYGSSAATGKLIILN